MPTHYRGTREGITAPDAYSKLVRPAHSITARRLLSDGQQEMLGSLCRRLGLGEPGVDG